MTNIHEDDNLANRTEVKNNELHVEKKDVVKKVLKKYKPTDYEREDILKAARKKAHNVVADAKRRISNEMRENGMLNESVEYWKNFDFNSCESYDFLEDCTGTALNFSMYKRPKVSQAVCEALEVQHDFVDSKYHTIGMFEGCFAPIGVMSRNNRVYDLDHYPTILSNILLMQKIATRAMLGTIGHHNKKVDDEDLANEIVSHVITCLEIREDEEGNYYLYGRAEILNTKAGRSLRTYYRHGIPLYVSSRGGGKLLDVPGQDYKRVDKNRYYLETFDVVKEPGFLEACPIANIAEDIDENLNEINNGESEMEKNEQVISENKEEITVIAEEAQVCEEPKKDTEDDEHGKAAEVVELDADVVVETEEPVVEEKEDEDSKEEKAADKEEIEEACDKEDDKKDEDNKEEIKEDCHEEDKKEDEEKAEDNNEEDKVDEACEEPKEEDKAEDKEEIEEACDKEEKEDKEAKTVEDEEIEEDYKSKYEALQPVIEELLQMMKDASENLQKVIAENVDNKAQIASLTEKLESLTKSEISEDQQEDEVADQTKVDDSDQEDGNQDATESLSEEKDEEPKEDDKEEDKEDEACHESEEKAEELGEQIAESVEGMNLVDEVTPAQPSKQAPQVYSAFRKSEKMQPSKYFSRFSK